MLRLSPSLIDSYRYWRSIEDEDRSAASLAELLASIRREDSPPAEAMVRGAAWHRALEESGREKSALWRGDVIEIEERGHRFRFNAVEVAMIRSQLPKVTSLELRGRLELPEVGVVLYLRTDGVVGNTIHEHKTTTRPDLDRYTHSCQWRAYLLAFDCRVVVYHVVQLRHDRRADIWQLKDYLPFRQYSYPRMRDDLCSQAAELAAFIRSQGLTEFREETRDDANAA